VQIKAFTSWLNGILKQRNLELKEIKTDLADGVKLINFLELLSGKKFGHKYDEKPTSRIVKIQNLHMGLTFLEKEMGLKPTSSAEDFVDHNLKMILGFLWSLFKKYRIQTIKQDDKSSEEGLLLWVKKTTEGYRDVHIESYKHSFRNGMAFLALCDKAIQNPEVIDYSKFVKENTIVNLTKSFELAEKELGVPKLLDPQEVSDGNVDERSLVLYISLYFHAFVAKQQQRELEKQKDEIERQMKGLQGSLEDRAKMAVVLHDENQQLKLEIERLKQELEESKKKGSDLEENKISLEQQVSELNASLEKETSERNREKQLYGDRAKVEMSGLNVLQKNLVEHVEDLHRWQKYLGFDAEAEVDFSGEIRPQILTEISDKNFEEQLQTLAKKLASENDDIVKVLKIKETEMKAKKELEKKKRDRQNKKEKD